MRDIKLVVNHQDNLARLLDATEDNPNELTVAGIPSDKVIIGLHDRDSGNNELWITVDRAQLEAALAVTKVRTVSQD
jgi:hypothetical protein